MKAEDVILVDYLHNSSQHESFNLSVISAISSFASITTALFIPGSSSGSYLGSFRKLPDTTLWRLRQLSTLPLLFSILLSARSRPGHALVFLQVLPLHYLFIVAASLFILRGNPTYICMHGELAALSSKWPWSPYHCIIRLSWLLSSYSKARLRFLCIDKRVYDNITDDYGAFESVSWIQHFVVRHCAPNPGLPKSSLAHQGTYGDLRLGSIGVHSSSKNSEAIYKVAGELASTNIDIFTCGLSDGSFEYKEGPNITHLFKGMISDTFISSSDYLKAICDNIDIVLLFHQPGSGYRYIVSGAIYDLIWLSIPAICSKGSPLLEYASYYDLPLVACDFSGSSIHQILTYLETSFFANTSDVQLTTNQHLREISIASWRWLLQGE